MGLMGKPNVLALCQWGILLELASLYLSISLHSSDCLHDMKLSIWYTLTVLIERKQPTSLIS